MGLIPVERKKDEEENEQESEASSSESSDDESSEGQSSEGGESEQEDNEDDKDDEEEYEGGEDDNVKFELAFFFGRGSSKLKNDEWGCLYVCKTLEEVIEVGDSQQLLSQLTEEVESMFEGSLEDYECFVLPKNWFVNDKQKEENWESKIQFSANNKFDQFAFLNEKKRVYLAFENSEDQTYC